MLRCTNEDCRQAFYIKLGPKTLTIGEVDTMELNDDVEVKCPVCDQTDVAGNWKRCFEDPLPFTFLEKENVCQCGGEIIQNMSLQAAIKTANITGATGSRVPLVCEDCGAAAGKVFASDEAIPTIEEIKKMRGYNNYPTLQGE